MEILNEDRFTCRATNNAIFALAMSLYLSSTQIIIAALRETKRCISDCFIAGSAKCTSNLLISRSRYADRHRHTHASMHIFADAATLYSDNIKREKTDIFAITFSLVECLLISPRFPLGSARLRHRRKKKGGKVQERVYRNCVWLSNIFTQLAVLPANPARRYSRSNVVHRTAIFFCR